MKMGEYSFETIADQMRTLVHQARGQGYSGTRMIIDVPEELAEQIPGELYLYNELACSELGYSWRELATLGNIQKIFVPSAEDVKPYRQFNIGGRIFAPSTLQRKNGTRVDVMRYLIFMGQRKGRRIISVLRPL